MKYFGLQSQVRRNNANSALILLMFPVVFIALTWLFFFLTAMAQSHDASTQQADSYNFMSAINYNFIHAIPWVLSGVLIWFVVAFFTHSAMIDKATSSVPLGRKENPRVYNLVENLCISKGMTMPRITIIGDDSLNAFASGINPKSYTVSLSRGIIEKLNDQELEAVIAHNLHISATVM